MTTETARILAQAIEMREAASIGLRALIRRDDIETPPPVATLLRQLAAKFVHEERVINRIIAEAEDE